MSQRASRPKRFRRYLLTEEQLQSPEHTKLLHPRIADLGDQWRAGILSDFETAARYILIFLNVYRSRDYLGGRHNDAVISKNVSGANLASFSESVQIFANYSVRSVPLAVNRTIVAWAMKRYPLRLLDYVPTAEELLEWQAQGERIVTCLFKPHELIRWVNDSRDPLGFVLHDLIHADHFFRDSALCEGQVEFYREIREELKRGRYTKILRDSVKRERFEYIVSDMNSHPAHLRACLAQLLNSEQQTAGLGL